MTASRTLVSQSPKADAVFTDSVSPPNMRVQRTRSSASPPRSPLPRWPLGGRALAAFALVGALLSPARAVSASSLTIRMVSQGGSRIPDRSFVTVGTFHGYLNSDGVARVLDLPAGDYTIVPSAEGFKPCFSMSVRVGETDDLELVLWMRQERWFGPSEACVIPPMQPPGVEITEPASVTSVSAGRPIKIAWRVVNGPIEPKGWEIRVGIDGCEEAMGREIIASIPLKSGRSSLLWTPTRDVMDWMARCDRLEEECHFWIDVSLYNAAARGETPGLLKHDDEMLAYVENCHPFPTDGAYVWGSSVYGQGRLRAAWRGSHVE